MSRFVLATTDAHFERRIRYAFGGALDGDLQSLARGPLPPDPAHLLGQLTDADAPEVVLLGPGVPTDDSLALAARFDEQRPDISVVLVTEPDPDLWSAAMRAGVRDILAPEADAAGIRLVLERASQAAANRRCVITSAAEPVVASGRVITVVSPKGGSGKTTVATNLAVGLAQLAPQATVLVDLDVQFGDVASALQLIPEHALSDAVHGPASQDAMVLKTFLSAHPAGLYALCAPESPADGDRITGEQITRLLELLACEFRYVVVDTAPGLSEHTLAALEQTTDTVLLCGMDVPSVRGLRKALDVLEQIGLGVASQSVVLNFVDPRCGLSVPDIEATIGTPVNVTLPRSRAVALSTNLGVPLLQHSPRDPVTKQLHGLVARFASKPAARGRRFGRKKVSR